MANKRYNAIPEPAATPESLRQSVMAMKEAFEVLTRQRQPIAAGAVTWQDLLDLKLIKPDQVPLR